MNKLAISLALVAMFVGLAAANGGKLGHRKHHNNDIEEELEEHKPIRHHGSHLGEHGIHRGEHGINRHGNRHGALGHKLRGKGAGAGVAAGAGIAGGIRGEHELDAGIHQGTRLGSHKSIEGHKGFVAGQKKGFNAGVQHHDSHDHEGHDRKSAHNKGKLIILEKDQGFEDDKGFHNHDDHSDQAHIGASDSKFIGGKVGGKAVSDKGFEHESGAGLHAESENAAFGGAGIGAGAGIGGGALDF